MPKLLSANTKNNVKSLILSGETTKDIVQATGVSRSQVIRMKNEQDPNRIRPTGGRPSTISSYTKKVVLFKVRRGYLRCAKDFQRYLWSLGYMLSYSSTTHVQRSLNLKSMFMKKKPFIRDTNQKKRLRWARKHRHWTVEDWKKVIFSDETKINRWG